MTFMSLYGDGCSERADRFTKHPGRYFLVVTNQFNWIVSLDRLGDLVYQRSAGEDAAGENVPAENVSTSLSVTASRQI